MDTIAAIVMMTVSSTIACYHFQDHCCFGCRNSFKHSFHTHEGEEDDDDIHHNHNNDYDSSDGTHKGIVIQTTTTTEKSFSPRTKENSGDDDGMGVGDLNEREIKSGGGGDDDDDETIDHTDGISELSSACHSFSVSSHNGNNKKRYSSPSNLLHLPNYEDDIIGPIMPLSHPISILNHRRYAFGNTTNEQQQQQQQQQQQEEEDPQQQEQHSRTHNNNSSTTTTNNRKVGFATTTKGRNKQRNNKKYTHTRTIDPRL